MRLIAVARFPTPSMLGVASERDAVRMGRGQNLVGGILIGTRLAMRLAGHFAPFSDRSRCHRRREPTARAGRGCIIYLLAVAEPRPQGAIVLSPPEADASARIGGRRRRSAKRRVGKEGVSTER